MSPSCERTHPLRAVTLPSPIFRRMGAAVLAPPSLDFLMWVWGPLPPVPPPPPWPLWWVPEFTHPPGFLGPGGPREGCLWVPVRPLPLQYVLSQLPFPDRPLSPSMSSSPHHHHHHHHNHNHRHHHRHHHHHHHRIQLISTSTHRHRHHHHR